MIQYLDKGLQQENETFRDESIDQRIPQEGISKQLPLILIPLEGPELWRPLKIAYLCYKSETLQNRSFA